MSSDNSFFNIRYMGGNDETSFFEVQSGSRPDRWFDVMYDVDHHWLCTCEQYFFRKVFCKHMRAVADMLGLSDVVVYQDVRI